MSGCASGWGDDELFIAAAIALTVEMKGVNQRPHGYWRPQLVCPTGMCVVRAASSARSAGVVRASRLAIAVASGM